MAAQDSEALGPESLSIALIGPDELRRRSIGVALAETHPGDVREYSTYPSPPEIQSIIENGHDVFILELDSDPEKALAIIEQICTGSVASVMMYSDNPQLDQSLLVRGMRAGAREFLNLPVSTDTISQALIRAAQRRPKTGKSEKRQLGRLLVFTGAKGGEG